MGCIIPIPLGKPKRFEGQTHEKIYQERAADNREQKSREHPALTATFMKVVAKPVANPSALCYSWPMRTDRLTRQWIERAIYDLETARGMIRIRKYLYAAFMCQQALEKMLKATLARQGKRIFPIHNLPRLAVDAGIFEACEQKDPGLLVELTPYCVKARYGEYKRRLSELCSRASAVRLVARTERMFAWLQRRIGSQRS